MLTFVFGCLSFCAGMGAGVLVFLAWKRRHKRPVPEAVPLVEVPEEADKATGPRWLQEMGIRWEKGATPLQAS